MLSSTSTPVLIHGSNTYSHPQHGRSRLFSSRPTSMFSSMNECTGPGIFLHRWIPIISAVGFRCRPVAVSV